MCLRPLEICHFFQRGDRLYTSESDVYRRQILTYKDGPSTERCTGYTVGRGHPTLLDKLISPTRRWPVRTSNQLYIHILASQTYNPRKHEIFRQCWLSVAGGGSTLARHTITDVYKVDPPLKVLSTSLVSSVGFIYFNGRSPITHRYSSEAGSAI